MADKQMCLACNIRPAVTSGPIPLCSACSAIAKDNKRGVKYEKDAKSPDTLRTGEPPPTSM